MGVPQIWELLQPHIKDKRVPFRKLAADFKRENGRSIRIAIDGFTWVFECGFITTPGSPERYHGYGRINKAVVNFLHRLKEFLSLDVTFIMVFDGNMKPAFKNHLGEETTTISSQLSEDFLAQWRRHEHSHREFSCCIGKNQSSLPEFMVVIKALLDLMNISYIEACGEGEAQCAWLQKNGYVDYVLSNDSDTLLFGCNKMLRNYSKSIDDFGVTGVDIHRPDVRRDAKESFVTVVELDEIRRSTDERYEWWSLLFFSVLLGADYNQGVKGLGKAKAAKLAQLRDPDFAMQFRCIFEILEYNATSRARRYSRFQEKLLAYCSQNSVKLFGRNYKALLGVDKMEGWPSETAVMCYFHPYLIPNLDPSVLEEKYVNTSDNESYKRIDFDRLRIFMEQINPVGVTYFDRWFWSLMQEAFVLRYALEKHGDAGSQLEISEEKTFFAHESQFTYSCWRLRFNNFLHPFDGLCSGGVDRPSLSASIPERPPPDAVKLQHNAWIPKKLLPESHVLIRRYRAGHSSRGKASPKKTLKYSPQKNTLDKFLSNHSSPVKDIRSLPSVSIPVLEPLKRRLFVDHEEETDSDLEANDSSLIILSESRVDGAGRTSYFNLEDELTQDAGDESPLKKQRLEKNR